MALNLFRKKDKPAPPAEPQVEQDPETEPDPGVEDESHDEPLSFQEVEEDEVSEADLPPGLATESTGGDAPFGAATTTVQRKRTGAHSGRTPAKGKRAARGKARPRPAAARSRPKPKRAPARKPKAKKAARKKR